MTEYEGFGASDISVRNIMSRSPLIIKEDEDVKTAAELMHESETGSLVVLDDERELTGILTEMDILGNIVTEGLDPEEVTVEEVMSEPVHTVRGDKPIQDAAELMADLEVRRLPVMDDEKMIGIITENDVLEISPKMIDITREYKRITEPEELQEYEEPKRREISGYCESCGVYSEDLVMENGQLMCPECE